MIETHELTKHFIEETVKAVDGIDLTVAPGELVALLGPNGAGKSTTLRMLTTLIPPTSGTARVAGFDVVRQQREVRQRIGYIGQGNGAGHSQRGRDELISQGRAYGMTGRRRRARRAAELIDSLGLGEVADRTVSTLSGGQRRRLDIAMGLIHAPELLFLDEPSTGLDPQNRANLQEHILELRERARHHDRADHALPGRGRLDGRAGHRGRPRPDHRRRHPGSGSRRRTSATGSSSASTHETDAATARPRVLPHRLRRYGHGAADQRRRARRGWSPGLLDDLRAAGIAGRRRSRSPARPSTTSSSS